MFNRFILLVIVLLQTLNINATVLQSNESLPFGSWYAWDDCKNYTFAYGFQIKVESFSKWHILRDDDGMTGIRLFCKGIQNDNFNSATPTYHVEGDWQKFRECSSGKYIIGFRLRLENPILLDNTAANDIEVKCNDERVLGGGGTGWGSFRNWHICPEGNYFCGVQTKVRAASTVDSVGLTDLRIRCCPSPEYSTVATTETLTASTTTPSRQTTMTTIPLTSSTPTALTTSTLPTTTSTTTTIRPVPSQADSTTSSVTSETSTISESISTIPTEVNSTNFPMISSSSNSTGELETSTFNELPTTSVIPTSVNTSRVGQSTLSSITQASTIAVSLSSSSQGDIFTVTVPNTTQVEQTSIEGTETESQIVNSSTNNNENFNFISTNFNKQTTSAPTREQSNNGDVAGNKENNITLSMVPGYVTSEPPGLATTKSENPISENKQFTLIFKDVTPSFVGTNSSLITTAPTTLNDQTVNSFNEIIFPSSNQSVQNTETENDSGTTTDSFFNGNKTGRRTFRSGLVPNDLILSDSNDRNPSNNDKRAKTGTRTVETTQTTFDNTKSSPNLLFTDGSFTEITDNSLKITPLPNSEDSINKNILDVKPSESSAPNPADRKPANVPHEYDLVIPRSKFIPNFDDDGNNVEENFSTPASDVTPNVTNKNSSTVNRTSYTGNNSNQGNNSVNVNLVPGVNLKPNIGVGLTGNPSFRQVSTNILHEDFNASWTDFIKANLLPEVANKKSNVITAFGTALGIIIIVFLVVLGVRYKKKMPRSLPTTIDNSWKYMVRKKKKKFPNITKVKPYNTLHHASP